MSADKLEQPSSSSDSAKLTRSVYIHTFGCQMNEYDSSKLAKILEQQYMRVQQPEQADLILINTCSVRDKPEQKLFSELGRYAELRKEKPDLMIGVGGCVAQQEGHKILDRSRAVDFVFGTHNLSLVPSLIERRKSGLGPQVAVDYRDEWEELPIGFSGDGQVCVFISISRGCNKNCTYCIVPTTRGKEVSRAADEIEREVKLSVHRGAREVVLLGQTVNSYGLDLEPRIKFTDLLGRLSKIEKLERIRFTSPHPQEIRQDFIDLIVDNPKICRHVHMPLQSGSDRILKLMNRNYRRKKYIAIIQELRRRLPDIAISTDIIVGFPGETEQDFQETMAVLEELQFESSFSFIFSPRPGTVAATMEDLTSRQEKLDRLYRLQARQDEISQQRLGRFVGETMPVLLDGYTEQDGSLLRGRTSQNVVVNLSKQVEGLKPGMIVNIRIEQLKRYTMRGEYIESMQIANM